MQRIIYIFLTMMLVVSCRKDKMPLYDNPFVYLATAEGAGEVTVGSEVKNVNTYYMFLSSKSLQSALTVNYEILSGDGLKEGVDYEMVTTGNSIVFLPGIFKMPIRIRWLPHVLDENKDNVLRISITGSDLPLCYGFPGPDSKQKDLKITKKNL